MAERVAGLDRAVLEEINSQLGIGVVLCDASDCVLWQNDCIQGKFPDTFQAGEDFWRFFQSLATDNGGRPSERHGHGEVIRVRDPGGVASGYRHLKFPVSEGPATLQVHCLLDVTHETVLEDTFLDQLQQLTSMKEIVDILYESVSTREVLYLILVAVTSQMGFGLNRAYYLEAQGQRLRGKIGIGPSCMEDAHRIWGQLAELNLPSLRAIYENLMRNGQPPDPRTQELAGRLDFRLRSETIGILGAIESRKPTLIYSSAPRTEVDDSLFELLGTEVVAVVPLYVRQSLAGVIIADNLVTKQPITEEALGILKTFSGYAGVALERSHLYDELRDSVSKLQAANERMKNDQRKLLQAEKFSAIGELAACVSHEIRNPLVAIGGLARSLLKDSEVKESHRDSLAIIVGEVARLEKFLRETLDFVKPEVDGARSVDLRQEIEQCAAAFGAELADNTIELELRLGPVPLRSLIDPDLFRRALSNLIRNAIDALGKEGKIVIEASHRDYSAEIKVSDTGPGIPADAQTRIFEPFFTTKSDGTGLGLAIASQGIRSLGGEISLQESSSNNTIFCMTLPLEEARLAHEEKPER